MAQFTVTITDAGQLAGISAARGAYNAALPATLPDPANPGHLIQDPAALLASDQDYVQFVLARAAASYAGEYKTGA